MLEAANGIANMRVINSPIPTDSKDICPAMNHAAEALTPTRIHAQKMMRTMFHSFCSSTLPIHNPTTMKIAPAKIFGRGLQWGLREL